MQVPQEVRNHYTDVQHLNSEPITLQHLLDLCNTAYTAYAMQKHPSLKLGDPWSPSRVEAKELNDMLGSLIAEYSDFHHFPWMKKIEFKLDDKGQTHVHIPDDYAHVMEYLIDFRRTHPELSSQHSSLPERAVKQRS